MSNTTSKIKSTANNMFGFIFEQTIVQTLIDFRIALWAAILFTSNYDVWYWYTGFMEKVLEAHVATNTLFPNGWDVPIVGFLGVALATAIKAYQSMRETINHRNGESK